VLSSETCTLKVNLKLWALNTPNSPSSVVSNPRAPQRRPLKRLLLKPRRTLRTRLRKNLLHPRPSDFLS